MGWEDSSQRPTSLDVWRKIVRSKDSVCDARIQSIRRQKLEDIHTRAKLSGQVVSLTSRILDALRRTRLCILYVLICDTVKAYRWALYEVWSGRQGAQFLIYWNDFSLERSSGHGAWVMLAEIQHAKASNGPELVMLIYASGALRPRAVAKKPPAPCCEQSSNE